jgi:hypothetical protein
VYIGEIWRIVAKFWRVLAKFWRSIADILPQFKSKVLLEDRWQLP